MAQRYFLESTAYGYTLETLIRDVNDSITAFIADMKPVEKLVTFGSISVENEIYEDDLIGDKLVLRRYALPFKATIDVG